MSDDDLREKIRDEVEGIVVGSGYYSMAIGIDAAGEVATAVLPIVWEAQGEAWDDCSDTAGDYLAGGSVRAAMALAEMNPYRQAAQR